MAIRVLIKQNHLLLIILIEFSSGEFVIIVINVHTKSIAMVRLDCGSLAHSSNLILYIKPDDNNVGYPARISFVALIIKDSLGRLSSSTAGKRFSHGARFGRG